MNNFQIVEFSKCQNHINRFVLKINFIKICIYNFLINMFIKKLKLRFGDRVAVLNDFFYQNRREYFFKTINQHQSLTINQKQLCDLVRSRSGISIRAVAIRY
jgi:hypothetical protein